MEEKRYPHIDEEEGIGMCCEPATDNAMLEYDSPLLENYDRIAGIGPQSVEEIGLPTRDIITDIMAMEFDSDEYDVVIGMDVICNGDFAITNQDDKTTFSFRIPSEVEIDFSK